MQVETSIECDHDESPMQHARLCPDDLEPGHPGGVNLTAIAVTAVIDCPPALRTAVGGRCPVSGPGVLQEPAARGDGDCLAPFVSVINRADDQVRASSSALICGRTAIGCYS